MVVAVWLAVRFVAGGPEDDWICLEGEWIKHGMPAEAKPIGGCGDEVINNFFECADAGYAVMESYPRQCRDSQDSLYIEDIGNELEKMDLIRIDAPRPNQKIESPLIIEGEARGYWFFEGDFPVRLYDGDGGLMVSGVATAQGEWMTEDFVGFRANLHFANPLTSRGWLVLSRDNPSGLPENDDELRVPVEF